MEKKTLEILSYMSEDDKRDLLCLTLKSLKPPAQDWILYLSPRFAITREDPDCCFSEQQNLFLTCFDTDLHREIKEEVSKEKIFDLVNFLWAFLSEDSNNGK